MVSAFLPSFDPSLFATTSPPLHAHHIRCTRSSLIRIPTCCLHKDLLPANYTEVNTRAVASVEAFLTSSAAVSNITPSQTELLEVQFPAVPNLATAALNELLDANRTFTLSFVRRLRSVPLGDISIIFPDVSEAKLARQEWGDAVRGLDVTSLPRSSVKYHDSDDIKRRRVCIVVNPGFNINEYLACEYLDGVRAIVMINGELDRVRSGYYPRLFYPRLWKSKERFLKRFQSVFYIKTLSHGGILMKEFPQGWKLLYKGISGDVRVLRDFGEEKPGFWKMEKLLKATRNQEVCET